MLNELIERQPAFSGCLYIPSRYSRPKPQRTVGYGFALSMPGPSRRPTDTTALHESGHAIAFLASGVAVRSVTASRDGTGKCTPRTQPCDRILALASACGALAEELDGDSRGRGSDRDDQLFRRSLAALGADPAAVVAAAESLLAKHRGEVLYLARALELKGNIGHSEFAELCRRPGSPLAPYAAWYPAKTSQPRKLSRLQGPQCVIRGGIF